MKTENHVDRQVTRHNCAYCHQDKFTVITIQQENTTKLFAICADPKCRAKQLEIRHIIQKEMGEEETNEVPSLMILTIDLEELKRDFFTTGLGRN